MPGSQIFTSIYFAVCDRTPPTHYGSRSKSSCKCAMTDELEHASGKPRVSRVEALLVAQKLGGRSDHATKEFLLYDNRNVVHVAIFWTDDRRRLIRCRQNEPVGTVPAATRGHLTVLRNALTPQTARAITRITLSTWLQNDTNVQYLPHACRFRVTALSRFRSQCAIARHRPSSDLLSTLGEHLKITTHAIMIGYGDIVGTTKGTTPRES